MNWKKGFGIGLLFIGLFLIVVNAGITGNVVGISDTNSFEVLGYLGVIVFLVGIFLIIATGTIDDVVDPDTAVDQVSVYDAMRGSSVGAEEDRYFMKDRGGLLLDIEGSDVNLGDFKAAYELVKDDQELIENARNVYGGELKRIVDEGTESEGEIALKFLNVLYDGKVPVVEDIGEVIVDQGPANEDYGYRLTDSQKDLIRSAFKGGWKGVPNRSQERVLREYELEHVKTKNYGRIRYTGNPDNFVTTSNTPSDTNAGKNIGRDVIRLIENSDRD